MKRFAFFAIALASVLLIGLFLCAQAEGNAGHEHLIRYQGYDNEVHYGRCILCGEEIEEKHVYTVCKPYVIKEGKAYASTGIHESFCEVCMNPKGMEMCSDPDGKAPFECGECLSSFGRFVFDVEEEHEDFVYRQLFVEKNGEYEASAQHAIVCEHCSSMMLEPCIDFGDSPLILNEKVHGYTCIVCREHFHVLEHQGAYQINGAEEHFIVCDTCGFEYLREEHEYVWYAYGNDPDNKTHTGYCIDCEYEPGVFLHEDGDNRCDFCLWELPFCMECGTNIKNM